MSAQTLTTGIGSSEASSADEAGRRAAAMALEKLGSDKAALVIAYATVAYDLQALLAGIRAVVGDVPVVGSSSCGQFHDGTYVPVGSGVLVLALSAGPYRFGVSSVDGLAAGDAEALGRTLAFEARSAAGPDLPPYGAVLLLSDGMAGHQQHLLNGMYRVTGAAIPVVGGASGDDFAFRVGYVFHDDRVLQDAAVAVWIGSETPLKPSAKHGYTSASLPLLVTRVDGLDVQEIAGRPARDVYQDVLGDHSESLEGRTYSVLAQEHPFGLIQADGSHLIRVVRTGDDQAALKTFTELPEFSAVNIMSGTADDLLAITEPLVVEALEGHDAKILLLFSCAARHEVLGDRVPEEAARFQSAAGDVPTFGFYTYGEYCRTRSVAGHHNATIAALAL
jgi:hypothetical protein